MSYFIRTMSTAGLTVTAQRYQDRLSAGDMNSGQVYYMLQDMQKLLTEIDRRLTRAPKELAASLAEIKKAHVETMTQARAICWP